MVLAPMLHVALDLGGSVDEEAGEVGDDEAEGNKLVTPVAVLRLLFVLELAWAVDEDDDEGAAGGAMNVEGRVPAEAAIALELLVVGLEAEVANEVAVDAAMVAVGVGAGAGTLSCLGLFG